MPDHSARDLKALRGLEPVRHRPEMYFGDDWQERAAVLCLLHLIEGSLASRPDGALHIAVTIRTDGWVTVADDGDAFGMDTRADGKPDAMVIGELHAGGWARGQIAIVNAFSQTFRFRTGDGTRALEVVYERGVLAGDPVFSTEPCNGTVVEYLLDRDLLPDPWLPVDVTDHSPLDLTQQAPRMRLEAPFNHDATIHVTDHRSGKTVAWPQPPSPTTSRKH